MINLSDYYFKLFLVNTPRTISIMSYIIYNLFWYTSILAWSSICFKWLMKQKWKRLLRMTCTYRIQQSKTTWWELTQLSFNTWRTDLNCVQFAQELSTTKTLIWRKSACDFESSSLFTTFHAKLSTSRGIFCTWVRLGRFLRRSSARIILTGNPIGLWSRRWINGSTSSIHNE